MSEGRGNVAPLTSDHAATDERGGQQGPIRHKEEGVAPPMPPDAYVKVEIVVKEEESSSSRPKRRGE